jgi:hypothetical protein
VSLGSPRQQQPEIEFMMKLGEKKIVEIDIIVFVV